MLYDIVPTVNNMVLSTSKFVKMVDLMLNALSLTHTHTHTPET